MSRDPAVAVAAVEVVLGESRRHEADLSQRVEANFATWICTCYSDDSSAPTWLIYCRTSDESIAWCRVPDEIEPLDLVDAQDTTGGHTSPGDVLVWLEDNEAAPWLSPYGSGDSAVLSALRDKILMR